MNFLQNLNRELGHTVIIITHDMPIVAKFAERVVVMANGKIQTDGPTADVFGRADVLSVASLEPPQVTQLAQRAQDLGFRPATLSVEDLWQQFQTLSGIAKV